MGVYKNGLRLTPDTDSYSGDYRMVEGKYIFHMRAFPSDLVYDDDYPGGVVPAEKWGRFCVKCHEVVILSGPAGTWFDNFEYHGRRPKACYKEEMCEGCAREEHTNTVAFIRDRVGTATEIINELREAQKKLIEICMDYQRAKSFVRLDLLDEKADRLHDEVNTGKYKLALLDQSRWWKE